MTEEDIIFLIQEDKLMMEVLRNAENLNLSQWMIGAGFVRNKVWDYLHGFKKEGVETNDIDLLYFDPYRNDKEADKLLSANLTTKTGIQWEIVNATYTHLWENITPYDSAEDALAHWPETATCVGVTVQEGKLKIIAPYGIEDLVNLSIKISPKFTQGIDVVRDRVEKKKWIEKWPKLKLAH